MLPFLLFLIFFAIEFQLTKIDGYYKVDNAFTKDCSKSNNAYSVVAVCDGDTIVIKKQITSKKEWTKIDLCSHKTDLKKIPVLIKIRLLGIDSFEIGQNEYGEKAKEYLTKILLNKKVCIETDIQKKDKYERTLGYVFLAESTSPQAQFFVNEELLETGYAILYSFPPNIKYIERLKKGQIYARENMLGIWEKQDYILETPYQFRKRKNKPVF